MEPLVITDAQDGERIALRVGECLRLRLPENPSSGYSWAFAALDEDRLSMVRSSFHPAGEGLGSGGEEEWLLRAERPGDTVVDLKLWRPWEGDASVIQRFRITLAVGSVG